MYRRTVSARALALPRQPPVLSLSCRGRDSAGSDECPRETRPGHVHFSQPLSSYSWRCHAAVNEAAVTADTKASEAQRRQGARGASGAGSSGSSSDVAGPTCSRRRPVALRQAPTQHTACTARTQHAQQHSHLPAPPSRAAAGRPRPCACAATCAPGCCAPRRPAPWQPCEWGGSRNEGVTLDGYACGRAAAPLASQRDRHPGEAAGRLAGHLSVAAARARHQAVSRRVPCGRRRRPSCLPSCQLPTCGLGAAAQPWLCQAAAMKPPRNRPT